MTFISQLSAFSQHLKYDFIDLHYTWIHGLGGRVLILNVGQCDLDLMIQ